MVGHEQRTHIGRAHADVALLKQVADEAADRTVRKWLIVMGLDPDRPLEAQQAFAALRKLSTEDAQADLVWLHSLRSHAQGLIGKIVGAVIVVLVANAFGSILSSFKGYFGPVPGAGPSH